MKMRHLSSGLEIAAVAVFAVAVMTAGIPVWAAPAASAADDLAARIRRVENGLVPNPGLYLSGRPAASASLLERMAQYRVPGVSIAVIDEYRISWVKGYGFIENGGQTAVAPETIFQAASISKPVSAAAALHFVEQGLLALDEDVNLKLKSWKVPDNEWTKKRPVTLRGILSHSAGLTVHGFRGYATAEAVPTLRQILDGEKPANSAAICVDTEIGAAVRYSGGGFTVLQQLLMDVRGEPYPEILRKTVLEPLGMSRSAYAQPLPAESAVEAARGHRPNGAVIRGGWHVYPELAAAGLWTTPFDLSRFAVELMLALGGRSDRVLSRAMADRMLTQQKGEFGLGIVLRGEGRTYHFTHSGGNEGFRCTMLAFPGTGRGAAIMTNGDLGSELILEILRSLATEYDWKVYLPAEKKSVPLAAAALDALAGTYELEPFGRLVVTREGDHLVADSLFVMPTGPAKCELYPESATAFFSLRTPDVVTFTLDETGRATGIVLKNDIRSQKGRRKP
jgi:CubicO group peptidase (beta-lactamase class C family)